MEEEEIAEEETLGRINPVHAMSPHQQCIIVGRMASQVVTTIPAGTVRTEVWATEIMLLLSTEWEAAPKVWNDG
jgi:hypothetical protein